MTPPQQGRQKKKWGIAGNISISEEVITNTSTFLE
jgi:hypothetical protein